MRCRSAGLGVRNLTVILIFVIVHPILHPIFMTDSCSLGIIALAHLVWVGMLRQDVRVWAIYSLFSAEESEYASAPAVTRRVVVGGTRAKTLFLTSVADEDNLEKRREEEEDTDISISKLYEQPGTRNTYTATIETAKQAVSIWQTCL